MGVQYIYLYKVQIYCFQHERTKVIYKYALDNLDKDRCEQIYKQYTIHEKKYGDRTAIEDVIVSKRRFQYEEVCLIFSIVKCQYESFTLI